MIRPYAPDDLEIIMDMANRAWRGINASYRRILGDELFDLVIPNEHTRKGQDINEFCREHPEWCLICEEEEKIVGFATFTLDYESKMGTISNNATDPDCGLKGIGQQMYSAILDRFRQKGMVSARVSTGLDEGHVRARAAYERAGFKQGLPSVTYYMEL
jgi:ribosomal protein S18 acetylase RimI-like enzyme